MKQFHQHNNKIGLGYEYTFFYVEENDDGDFTETFFHCTTGKLMTNDYDEDERLTDSIEILTIGDN